MGTYYRFRCTICGDGFNLNNEDTETYNEGYFTYEPDVCDECNSCNEQCFEHDSYSDADPGL